ncbi:MBL fold metallo-hydrolase [Candidatus Sumerlaeota bacterium]|nr:MBL fold metallo-hydrolase [Candidatus Sumerlaeota bacterium]
MTKNIAPNGCAFVIEPMVLPEMDQNGYLVYDPDTRDAIVIDPSLSANVIDRRIQELNLNTHIILDTHGHIDHILAQEQLRALTKAQIWINEDDALYLCDPTLNASAMFDIPFEGHEPDHLFKGGDSITAGTLAFEVIQVSGHTPGSSLFVNRQNKVVFTGDHVFAGSIGRTDLNGSTPRTMDQSLRIFMQLPPDFAVYPGHGPATTVARELRINPFLVNLK